MINLTTLSTQEAGINADKISGNAMQVVTRLQDHGYDAYLVGGCVRDLILDLEPKDFDVSTNATPEQVKKVFNRNGRIIGRRFKIVHVRFGYDVIEVATFRADANDRDQVGSQEMTASDEGQLLRDNVYGSIEEDVVRRDFTANALYFDPVGDKVLDFIGSIDAIQNAQLISIGEPAKRFREDPVRMLRVVRFAAKLGFSMEPEAEQMIEEEGKLLAHVSPARLFEEVLKLFHGGAAHRTYLMLRQYDLFKYLFPFTDQVMLDGTEGLPELALKNTDKRIQQGKPVIPAFLFACLLWDPVKADALVLMDDGAVESQAWRVAMNDALRDQNQYVSVPRRLAEIILDIWNIHFKLIKRNPRTIKSCLSNRRFRAAYDFLLLRTQVHEVDKDIADWWTKIQEVQGEEKAQLMADATAAFTSAKPQRGKRGEPNGNSIDYQPEDGYGNQKSGNQRSGSKANQQKRNRKNSKKASNKNQKQGGNNSGGQASSSKGKSSKAGKKRSRQYGNGTEQHSKNSQPGRNKNQRGKNQRRKKQRANQSSESQHGESKRSYNARPKDEYGVFSGDADMKKVKVRRKKKVSISRDGDRNEDEVPHF
ncbi:MAG: polynucleotide adenylyltransferase PcnB [Pseudomonadota bacterium]